MADIALARDLVGVLRDAGYFVRDPDATAASWKLAGLLDFTEAELSGAVKAWLREGTGRTPTTDELRRLAAEIRVSAGRYYPPDTEPGRRATPDEVRAAWEAQGIELPPRRGS